MKPKKSIQEDDYTVIRSRRRSVTICIDQNGHVSVRAPFFVSNHEIERIVAEKKMWIEKKQQQILKRKENPKNHVKRTYQNQSTMPYRGIEYPVQLVEDSTCRSPRISFQDQQFQVISGDLSKDVIRNAFILWYRKQARIIFQDRIDYYEQTIQEPYGQIRIKEQKTCYGSCSAKRNLNFNWKCIIAPPAILDYIVVHELCHLKQLNHSRLFWMEVEKVLPDYKKAKLWLRENEGQLQI